MPSSEGLPSIEPLIIELARWVRQLAALVEDGLGRRYDARLARRLAGTSEFSFSWDFVSRAEAAWEEHLAEFAGKPDVALLEIGSYEGRSAVWFLQHVLTHPTSRMTCIDLFVPLGGEPRFDHNIALGGWSGRVRKIKGRSEGVLETLDQDSYDIVYVDGSHRAADVLMDAISSWRLLKRGGVLIFDDYEWQMHRPPEQRPAMAIDMFLRLWQPHLAVLLHGYQVIVRKLG